jgi:stearoyl-CoA desaturase (delta-9 desaturase)
MATIPASADQVDTSPVVLPAGTTRQSRCRVDWITTIVILGLHVGAVAAFFPPFLTWQAVVLAVVMQLICGLGVTVGYHRLLTHRSFRTIKPVEYFLSWLGSLNLQGGPIHWTATHRLHHQHSDTEQDPHTPRHGFFWAHMKWCLMHDPEFDPFHKYSQYAKDLARDIGHRIIEHSMLISTLALAAVLYWVGGWSFVMWGICVRLVYVYHITWLVNSATHTWGYRNFETKDDSRNLWWVGLTAFGEGWHNNHHAWPRSARHGMKPWEFDISWITIRFLQMLGLAYDIRLPGRGASMTG